jgi:cysteinyl-tRNA synthetase
MPRLELTLYNTLTRREEPFRPLDPPRVRMYNCGPTVYNYAHIGNLSAFAFADVLRRALEYAGYEVTQVMNITDVGHLTRDDLADAQGEDKLDLAARRERRSPWDLARHYTHAFFADMEALNIRAAHYHPRATEFVPEMIELIRMLEAKGLAYRAGAGGDVYFDVAKFPEYGRLSGNTLESLAAGARVDVREEKRSPHDFALWKSDPKHIMQWDSPWGPGFPGWHIECSAMARRFLGDTIDIHTGGEDHIFPHHECEIAQSEGATGKPFARFWMHKRFILVGGKKMAKSAENFYTLGDLAARGFTGRDLRYFFLQTHYRAQANFTFEGLEAARKALERLDNFVAKTEAEARPLGAAPPAALDPAYEEEIERARRKFDAAIAADLNLSGALGAIFDLVREGNRRALAPAQAAQTMEFLRSADEVLGFLFFRPPRPPARFEAQPSLSTKFTEEEAEALLARREAARKAKDFAEADRIRDELRKKGYAIEDTAKGARIKRI